MPKAPSKDGRVDLVCQQCGKQYWTFASRFTMQRKSKFCSMKCSGLFHRNKVEKKCLTCGKYFKIVPSQFSFYKGAGKYCSRNCSYQGIVKETSTKPIKDKYGRSKRKADKEWKMAVRERDNYTCRRCGKFDKYIHTHHVKPRSRFPELKHDINNGICLDNSCHTWVHNHPKEATLCGLFYVGKYAI